MDFELSSEERSARAGGDFRIGLPVLLTAGDSCLLALAAETLTDARLQELRALGRPEVVVTARRAETLRARAYDGDIARIVMPAEAGAAWVRATADPAHDLRVPLKGPYQTRRGGDPALERLAVEMAKRAHLLPAAVVLPGAAALRRRVEAAGLTILSLADAARARPAADVLEPVANARVPLEVSEAGRVHVFRPRDGGEEHYAVEIGTPDRRQPVLSRLHSACFTGDLVGSLKCDCGPQLRAALAQIGEAGAGVLLYLNQEGRGIGLANKMRAYSLQDQGFDTVEANHRLGFEDDERDFRVGAEILKKLGFSSVRLMTNNPRKVAMMEGAGVAVAERVPLKVGLNEHNRGYLQVKAAKSGHLL